jgi:hypothetical protein
VFRRRAVEGRSGGVHAEGHEDVQAFFRECASNDADRAVRCHELLVNLTKDGGIGSA